MLNKIRSLIRWVRVTMAGDDDKQFPVQQIEYLGKVADCYMLFPFGMHANADADALAVMFSIMGNAENRVAIPSSPKTRPQMAAGEVCIYHPGSSSIIHFKSSGDIEITPAGDLIINGNLTVTGDTALGSTVTSNGTNIGDTHVHSGVQTGGGTSGPPV